MYSLLSPHYLKTVCHCNANIGRNSITELHFYNVTDDKFFGAEVDLLAASDGNCILQLATT